MTPTKYYALDLYEESDNANLMDGFNHDMSKLDLLLYQTNSALTSVNVAVKTLQTQVASLEQRVATLEQKASA